MSLSKRELTLMYNVSIYLTVKELEFSGIPILWNSANEFKRSVVFCCRGGGNGGRSLLVVTQQNSPVPP